MVDDPVQIEIKGPVLFREEVEFVPLTFQTDPAGELIFIKKGNNCTRLHDVPVRRDFCLPLSSTNNKKIKRESAGF